jgi:hypothetical protein
VPRETRYAVEEPRVLRPGFGNKEPSVNIFTAAKSLAFAANKTCARFGASSSSGLPDAKDDASGARDAAQQRL